MPQSQLDAETPPSSARGDLTRLDDAPARTGRTANDYGAVIFDLDGVVTDTARLHAIAWKALFDPVLSDSANADTEPFDAVDDYRRWVDGRPREDGVRSFLRSRGIHLPEGAPDDPPDRMTVAGLAARKQQIFAAELASAGVQVFPDAARLLRELRAAHVPTALVTASRNGAEILDAAGISEMFTARVDGTEAQRMSLAGKPNPATFLEAARRLEIEPIDAVVIEDASAGVSAASKGGFGLVVGVDRDGAGAQLAEAGADVVVTDLGAIGLADSAPVSDHPDLRWCGGAAPIQPGGWNLTYDHWDPSREGTREALCTMGNGYWATRAAHPGTTADAIHYPGTYIAGIYNRCTTVIKGWPTETEHMVNAPDWTFLSVRLDDGTELRPGIPEMLSHRQNLDLRTGTLTRVDRYKDEAGRATTITTRQFHSMAEFHLAAIQLTIEAENWSGPVTVTSMTNADVANRNAIADRDIAYRHLLPGRHEFFDQWTVLHESTTDQSRIDIAVATRTSPGGPCVRHRRISRTDSPGIEFTFTVQTGTARTIEKVAALTTSRDRGISTAALDAAERIADAPGFAALRAEHIRAWTRLWRRFGIVLGDGKRHRMALNLHVFHVLQTTTAAGPDADIGLPARGLHGEAYRGHIFWDELFVYPMLTLRSPGLTRAFLEYRYRRLPRAKTAARRLGLEGALFPWRSGSDGREETPTRLLNTRTGSWMPDNSHQQRHVGLAIAYIVWQYYQSTADLAFLMESGAEMVIEIARLFASMAVHDPGDDRFDIDGVMGPDEYHDGYPDSPGSGVRNNAYTNVLTAWVLARAGDVVDIIAGHDNESLHERLALRPDEPEHWDRISRRLRVPFHEDGIISQFEGYEALDEFDWESYRAKYGNIGRLDLILHSEGDSTNRYKLSKQADVLMLFYLFSAEELRHILDRLGYSLPPEVIPRTVGYYLARTSHGSTLSRLAHSWVLARTDRAMSWGLFSQALEADLDDTQEGTTREGVHIGAMAGTADMVLRCYGGVETRRDTLWLHPVLPDDLPEVEFTLSYRDQPLTVQVSHSRVVVRLHPSTAAPIRVHIEDVEKTLTSGQLWEVPLR
ncbi:beta-phosphoglucomutase family hydrolase [Nocardia sp. NPDC005366]|uniref:beta-phosphoglucomutase family hydrolase n=1 Tax=Nocardia sp. NPDC005366 TaxID=3156878 RepID=UPI0033B2692D